MKLSYTNSDQNLAEAKVESLSFPELPIFSSKLPNHKASPKLVGNGYF